MINKLFFFQKNTNRLVEFAYAHLREEKNEVKLRSFSTSENRRSDSDAKTMRLNQARFRKG